MVGSRNDSKEVRREAKRLLREILGTADPVSRVYGGVVRCLTCEEVVRIAEAEPVYDENGDFCGWECERHI